VIRERLGDRQQDDAAPRLGEIGVARGRLVARDDGVAGRVGVVDKEEAVLGVLRMEREAEEPALFATGDQGRKIEERNRLRRGRNFWLIVLSPGCGGWTNPTDPEVYPRPFRALRLYPDCATGFDLHRPLRFGCNLVPGYSPCERSVAA
jgi:hypothetical protein